MLACKQQSDQLARMVNEDSRALTSAVIARLRHRRSPLQARNRNRSTIHVRRALRDVPGGHNQHHRQREERHDTENSKLPVGHLGHERVPESASRINHAPHPSATPRLLARRPSRSLASAVIGCRTAMRGPVAIGRTRLVSRRSAHRLRGRRKPCTWIGPSTYLGTCVRPEALRLCNCSSTTKNASVREHSPICGGRRAWLGRRLAEARLG